MGQAKKHFSGFTTFWLVVTPVVSGAVVMAVELLGARMLSVGYGGSLTVWAAMISVTLLSLAIGYFLGGFLADRCPRPWLLHLVLIAGAVLVAACPHARFVLKACYNAMGIQWGALASSAIIFLIPLGLLGMIGPFVIRLLSEAGRGIGMTAGGVYAISTIGSVAGTLLTGFWLIPRFGTPVGLTIAALAAAATGAVGLIGTTGRRARTATVIAVLLTAGGLAAAARWKAAAEQMRSIVLALIPATTPEVGLTYMAPDGEQVTVKAVRDSAHGHIVVLRKGRHRLLVVNGIVQTGIPMDLAYLEKGQCLANRYYQELLPYMTDDPGRASALIVGLAGGMTASLLKHYEMEVECVDLDPAIIETARQWFWFTGHAVAGDGRQHMEDCRKRYDFCVIDTYSGDVFPFYLASVEAFRAARNVLKPKGVLAINFIGSPDGRAFACIYKTLEAVFPNVRAIKGEAGDDVQTITLFASARAIEFNSGWLDHTGEFTGEDPIGKTLESLTVTPACKSGFVLTDLYNPIDFLRADEARRWRRRTIERIIGEKAVF